MRCLSETLTHFCKVLVKIWNIEKASVKLSPSGQAIGGASNIGGSGKLKGCLY